MYPQESDTIPTVLVGESRLLQLISTNAPLPEVLNKICAALDVQLGNVVSLVLSAEDNEHSLHHLADQAAQFGLHVFCCSAILSPQEQLLATFETYCCCARTPTLSEASLIQRACQIAALAIQRHEHELAPWHFASAWNGSTAAPRSEHNLSEN